MPSSRGGLGIVTGMSDFSDGTWEGAGLLGAPTRTTTASGLGRYRDEGALAMGGMSEVRRVWDTVFGFHAAMKLLRDELLRNSAARARFTTEALITARIQHPGVVAVYAQGETEGGRPWFTMTEVRGETFSDLIARVHEDGPIEPGELRRLVGLLLRAADAVAYAHSQKILHRDLKPDNLMVGAFGEVLVMDWGLARALDLPDTTAAHSQELLLPDAGQTRMGDVLGTPAYMPPEQARGQLDQLGPSADVFALGAVLHEVLRGRPPATGSAMQVWRERTAGVPPLFADDGELEHLPAELILICMDALAEDPADRYADAGALGDALREWLDGAQRRAKALEILAQAAPLRPTIDTLRAEAADKRARAAAIMAPLPPHAPVEQKAPAWDLEDEAEVAEREAVVREVRWQQVVGTALEQVPDLPEAHAVLADHYAERLLAAEQGGRRSDVARFETLLADHDRGQHAKLLSGIGAVTLVTDPPGAEVRLYEYVEKRRRLVPEFRRVLGRTPLVEVTLERGSWLLELHLEGHHVVNYPVYLERGEAWDGVRPGSSEPFPVVIPRLGELGEDECYVPAGWFIAGGDPLAIDSLPRQQVWVDGFCIGRGPVCCSDYAREAATSAGALVGDGSAPVVRISWHDARTFVARASERTGLPLRLPHELEWAKAARGVDRRVCAWGDHLELSWANVAGSTGTTPAIEEIGARPVDCSVYGVHDTVGNVRDWCSNSWTKDGDPRWRAGVLDPLKSSVRPEYITCRGGAWSSVARLGRAATRFAGRPDDVFGTLGFRVARSIG